MINPRFLATTQAAYHMKITGLLKQRERAERGKQKYPAPSINIITHCPSAWREFQARIEKELRPEGRLIHCLGWGAKYVVLLSHCWVAACGRTRN